MGVENNENNINAFNVYPNPSKGKVTLSMYLPNTSDMKAIIYNSLGQTVFNNTYLARSGTTSIDFDLAHLTSGIYFLKVIAGKSIKSAPIIKQ